MAWWNWKFRKATSTVESLLRTAVRNQEKIMGVLDDLKVAVEDIAHDATQAHDEVLVAVEHIIKAIDLESHPELKAAVESLRDSHSSFAASLKTLKDKVDEVMASGGPAA